MMTVAQMEQRLSRVERTVANLAKSMKRRKYEKRWYVVHAGRFANDPIFNEIVRLGRDEREKSKSTKKVKRAHIR